MTKGCKLKTVLQQTTFFCPKCHIGPELNIMYIYILFFSVLFKLAIINFYGANEMLTVAVLFPSKLIDSCLAQRSKTDESNSNVALLQNLGGFNFFFAFYLAAEFYEHCNVMPKQKVNGIG